MRRLLLLAAMAAGGLAGTAGGARADGNHSFGPVPVFEIHSWCWPKTTSVTWPSVMPPGWYSNTYRHQWYQPWYAYYNFSHGPYANWAAGGGYAAYSYNGPAGVYNYNKPPAEPYLGEWYNRDQAQPSAPGASTPAAPAAKPLDPPKEMKGADKGQVSVTLPADAKLLFNGVAANGTGGVRTFETPPLQAGQSYQYQLTAEVTRDGRTERVSETVTVRAGATTRVTLTPSAVLTAGAK